MNLHPGCYPGLYSLWGFAPSLLITLAAEHSAGLFSCSGFAPYCLYCDYYALPWAVFPLGLRPVPARYISSNAIHNILFVYGSTFSHNRISRVFTTRPCRSVSFRCYDEKYYFCCLICLKILLFYLEQMVCLLRRRAESPIGIQPRAAPWVKRFQQTCALKEQKERTNEHFAGSCCAYSAPIS